jgi:hypothetical protein
MACIEIVLLLLAFVWFVAVIKVFVLEERKVVFKKTRNPLWSTPTPIINDMEQISSRSLYHINQPIQSIVHEISIRHPISQVASHSINAEAKGLILPPLSTDWLSIHALALADNLQSLQSPRKLGQEQFLKISQVIAPINAQLPPNNLNQVGSANANIVNREKIVQAFSKPASELHWPPVLPDFTISEEDGSELMPIIDIRVPRFWFPPEGTDYNTAGYKVNNEDTIFLMIASFRDFQCRETITSAFMRADHPERLFVGAVDQLVPGDIGCLDIEIPCSQDPSQPICKYRDQISIYKMDAQYATGPVTARHIGDRMYRGQTFAMQLDAHCHFVRHWDSLLIDQWISTHNEMAVLSSYLSDVQGSLTKDGDSTRSTRPIMCNSDFEGAMPARYLRHGAQPEEAPQIKDMPQLQPFWAAGFSFSKGHFKLRVPYDAYQPMVFQGEEIVIGIRGFTHGYDFYAPQNSVVFHEYAVKSKRRSKVHMFWENTKFVGMGQRSLKRATSIVGMAPDIDPESWDHSEIDRYGLGTVRPLSLFYKLFLIDTHERKATQLCPFVKSGIMHRDFQGLLRTDGMGINYSLLETYDTRAKLEAHLSTIHPRWMQQLESSIDRKDRKAVQEILDNARRSGWDKQRPEIIDAAQEAMSSW